MNQVSKIDNSLMELQNTQKLCQMLMQSPHYQKIGKEGIFAVVEMSKSVGVDPLQALNGGMYFVRGKVEMSALMMNTLIRQAGHSITKDKKSDETICILHGKRADTGDTWVESFSMKDAAAAGLANSPTWKAYKKDMLFARALSRLARQLFPDVIKGCYVQGEISMDTAISGSSAAPIPETIGKEAADDLMNALAEFPDYEAQVQSYLDRMNIEPKDLPIEHAEKMITRLERLREEACIQSAEIVTEVAHG